nr:hypothetical protein [Morchella crassipes]
MKGFIIYIDIYIWWNLLLAEQREGGWGPIYRGGMHLSWPFGPRGTLPGARPWPRPLCFFLFIKKNLKQGGPRFHYIYRHIYMLKPAEPARGARSSLAIPPPSRPRPSFSFFERKIKRGATTQRHFIASPPPGGEE